MKDDIGFSGITEKDERMGNLENHENVLNTGDWMDKIVNMQFKADYNCPSCGLTSSTIGECSSCGSKWIPPLYH